MKTILVTGAKGFIGSQLVSTLQSSGYTVVTFDSEDGDIVSTDLITRFQNTTLSHIFHLAAKTFVPDSWLNPSEFNKVSIMGTQQILELCRDQGCSLTFVSAYVYGTPESLPISENIMPKPNNPYALSKYLAEELCRFYNEYYDTKVIIARPFNIYGKNQNDTFLIPHIINQILTHSTITVKNLTPKRDYIFLDDLIDGLIKTIHVKEKFTIYNFGSSSSLSVKNIIDIIQTIAQTDKEIRSEEQERPNEILDVVADISKAKQELNWEPKYSFEDGIREILKDIKYAD